MLLGVRCRFGLPLGEMVLVRVNHILTRGKANEQQPGVYDM